MPELVKLCQALLDDVWRIIVSHDTENKLNNERSTLSASITKLAKLVNKLYIRNTTDSIQHIIMTKLTPHNIKQLKEDSKHHQECQED
jgi:hypothetical protein